MRIFLAFSLLLSTAVVAHEEAATKDKKFVAATPVEMTDAGAVYGERLPSPMPTAVDLESAITNAKDHADKPMAFSGRITEVCQKMGCWVVLTGENGSLARVTMHDHAFGVPKDSSGSAIVFGTLSEATLSKDDIKEMKNDGAKTPVASEWRIDAVSVVIPHAG